MKVDGKWVGWGLGDIDPQVAKIKAYLKRKYSYGSILNDTPVYSEELVSVVKEAQARLGLPVTGIYDYATQIKTKFVVAAPRVLPIFYTVEGHMSDMMFGPIAETAKILEREGRCRWQPIGYNSTALPFDNESGAKELARLFFADVLDNGTPNPKGTKKLIGGFSQGAICVTDFLIDYAQKSDRIDEILAVLQYGNPSRDTGSVASWAIPEAGPSANYGMESKKRLELQFPDHKFPVVDVYRKGDIFSDCPPDMDGQLMRACYEAIARSDFFGETYSLAAKIGEAFGKPVEFVIGVFKAIFAGIGFLANQQGNPHYSPFNIDGGLNWARTVLSH